MATRFRQAAAAAVVDGGERLSALRKGRRLLRAGAVDGVIAFPLSCYLARPLAGSIGAFVAVLIVDGMHYFHYTSVKFNHDVVQLPVWALAGYAFHAALGADASGTGCCSVSPLAARYGQNILSSC